MPHSRPEGLVFERRNGAFSLVMMGHPHAGLQYRTVPRLLLAWLTTEAVRTRERELVLGDTLSRFMAQLDLIPTGGRWGTITRLRDQMRRLFASTVSCTYDAPGTWALETVTIADRARLWWDPKQPDQAALWASSVLRRQYPDSPYLSVSELGGPLTPATVRKLITRAGEKAKLPFPIHPHMLRHSTGYKLANDGHDTRAIEQYLGHRNITHTVRYTELSPERFKGFWKD